jgi:hypothetical protein
MMKSFLTVIALALLPSLANAADKLRHKSMPPCMSNEQYSRLADRLAKNPPYITRERLPRGSKIGRCLFEVNGKPLISGTCVYSISKGGSFQIDGPRQIYSGIDYPECFMGAATFTTDYFVQVDWLDEKELDDGSAGPGWEAHWNGEIGSNHAEAFLGSVKRDGACYSNSQTKICLWAK